MASHGGKGMMGMKKFLVWMTFVLGVVPCAFSGGLFFEDEPVQDGLRVFDVSNTFADIYEKLDSVNWAGKSLNVAIESVGVG